MATANTTVCSTFLLESPVSIALLPRGVEFLGVLFGVLLWRSKGVRGDFELFVELRRPPGDLEPLEFLRELHGVGGPGLL